MRFLYDGLDRIATLDASGTLLEWVTFGPGIDEPLGREDAAGRRLWYRANHQGSVMALEDGTTTTDTYRYSPYGLTQATGPTPNAFRYTGREYEAEDLYHYRARYYDPTVGRFLSQDPVHFHGGTNLYLYGEARPTQFIDPLGLDAYMCTKPLDALGDLGKWAYDLGAPLLYHQYICVKAGGRTICGGQDRSGGPYSPGKPSRDYYNGARCEKVDDRPCVDRCLIENIRNPTRPFYGLIGPGTNCQE